MAGEDCVRGQGGGERRLEVRWPVRDSDLIDFKK